ncbi:MAG: hypothetical protein AAB365_03570 [Patescibacteria group bacterium]
MKKISLSITAIALWALPFVTFAQTASNKKDLAWVINIIIGYINQALVLLMGVAVIIFVYYVVKYFILPNENRSEAGSYVMYSLIGFFVILSFWGLVNILQGTFGLQNDTNRPAGWSSFTNIFPGGSSSSGSGTFNPTNTTDRNANR